MKNFVSNVAAGIVASIAFVVLGYFVERTAKKINAKSNADIRAASAQERIANGLERISRDLESTGCHEK